MSTTSCKYCGKPIEACLDACDDCIEEYESEEDENVF